MRRTAPLLTILALAGCAVVGGNPYPEVPPLQAETMPLPPVTATPLIWQPGHWDWTGAGYAWQPGAYVPREGHSNRWMPAHWELIGSTWVWEPAHWL
jgi:hypothetical protein